MEALSYAVIFTEIISELERRTEQTGKDFTQLLHSSLHPESREHKLHDCLPWVMLDTEVRVCSTHS